MNRFNWILNIIFLIILVAFICLALWLAAEADRAHACLLNDACIEKYRAKIELETDGESRSPHIPSVQPRVIGGRPYIFFF